MNKFIRLDNVKTLTGLSRSSIYQFIADGSFPSQLKLGERAVAWDEGEIKDWMNSRISARSVERAKQKELLL